MRLVMRHALVCTAIPRVVPKALDDGIRCDIAMHICFWLLM
jgi:hypothetical protein